MPQQPPASPPPFPRTHIRVKTLVILFLSTCLITLFIAKLFVKPYRATLEVTISNAHQSPVFVYFSSKHAGYTPENVSQSFEEAIDTGAGPRTVQHRIELASFKPLYFLRLDPQTKGGSIQLRGMKLETVEGSISFSPQEIEKMALNGSQINGVHLDNETVLFNSTGIDPHFEIAVPKHLVRPKLSTQARGFFWLWLSLSLPLMAAIALLYRNGLPLLDEGYLTISNWRKGVRTHSFAEFFLEWTALVVLGIASQQFIELHSGIHVKPLAIIFSTDGVGESVPKEVRFMKSIVSRQGIKTYALAGDLGRGEELNEIYQRATEYLFPALIDNKSRLIFARSNLKDLYERRLCRQLDSQQDILLYDCKN